MKSSTQSVYRQPYKGVSLEVTETIREGGPLMAREFMVFVGGDCVQDELETLTAALAAGRANIDSFRTD